MKVTIIGSGNVAEAFSAAITRTPGLTLAEICSRNELRGRELAARTGTRYNPDPAKPAAADLYLIAVSDSAVAEVSSILQVPAGATVAHTSGGLAIGALTGETGHRAVIYPLQTFSAGREVDFGEIPIFIEYETPQAEKTSRRFAEALSRRVENADSALRNRLHIAAAFSCNFVNYLYSVGAELGREWGFGFDTLKPLIKETAEKALESDDPADVQTGPASRHDESTMARHMAILDDEGKENYLDIYKLLSENIWETSKKI